MKGLQNSVILTAFFLATISSLFSGMVVEGADLNTDTLKAWNLFVESQEKRITEELASQNNFLVLDFQKSPDSDLERRSILSGNVSIKPVASEKSGSGEIRIPGGMIHHWRGSIWVPGMNLDFVLSRVQHPELETTRQEDVLDSRVLERSFDQMKLYIKLQRSRIITAVYNTEHSVRFYHHGNGRASSRSISTKIAEVEHLNDNKEREKPVGQDRGFLWKMNSYWRYQQVAGGVIIECESITLSRSIPYLLETLISPIVRNIAKESMQRTLQSMRVRLEQAYQSHMATNSLGDPPAQPARQQKFDNLGIVRRVPLPWIIKA
jgi:hypothetical protein